MSIGMKPWMLSPALLCALGAGMLLAACGDRGANDAPSTDQADALPKPEAGGGSITGMSAARGPGEVPLSGHAPEQPLSVQEDQVDLLNPETGLLPGGATASADATTAPVGEPTAQDAIAVVREYYASIDSRSYARAYALWSDGGRASKQTPQQFADGFAQTTHVEVAIGEPGNEDAGAGQRYLQLPVTVTATRADGSVHRYAGQYTLHRTVVDGASAEQRAWRIDSADLRELTP